ncbi:c-type cytochrome [Psychromonas ossibalaenae]|uniref:c-type cytochrome n=1 Tax=Psychromonas ossibalaenae TaxID=444922 RepID=UPI00035E7ADE|nr:cytochrome c5 family protein [Psychromonas ossibalaenae]
MHLIKRITLLIGLTISLFSTASFAQDLSEGAIADRIAPVGDVYLDGEIAVAGQSSDSDEPAGPRDGEKIYNTYCVACHATGAAGAPKKGDAAAWEPRIAQGQETLLKHSLEGLNAMPAKGTCADCSDDEMAATVEFLTKGLF